MPEIQDAEVGFLSPYNMDDPATRDAIAWLAGFIDGEGSIGLSRQRDKRKGENYYAYRASLQISNTVRSSLEWCQIIIGSGQIVHSPRKHHPQKDNFKYSLRSQVALVDLLLVLSPFLKIKKSQCELVIFFCLRRMGMTHDAAKQLRRGWYRPYDVTDHQLYQRSLEFNKRGRELPHVN